MSTLDFEPIKAKKMYEEVVSQIRRLIDGGELKPGDRLLPERELSDKLQVSRASIREAIRSLEMMGLIEIRRGDGTYVTNPAANSIIHPLAMFLAADKSSVLEMFELRRVFEGATAGMAAERATSLELKQIRIAFEKMQECLNVRDPEKGEEYDIAFHYAIAEATHNRLLIRLFKTIADEFSRAISISRKKLYCTEGSPHKLIDQHRRIYEAIKLRDPEEATRCMLEHLAYVEKEIKKKMR